jgi:NitT/TauT family transport system permease protein
VIVLYDQLLFRPLLKWSDKFKVEDTAAESSTSSWVLSILSRGNLSTKLGHVLAIFGNYLINAPWFLHKPKMNINPTRDIRIRGYRLQHILSDIVYFAVLLSSVGCFMHYILAHISMSELMHVIFLGAITATRVIVLIIGASLIWVPVGVWVGMRPRVAQMVQPIAQFLAAFPANLFFPVVVMMIVKYQLNVEIWTTPLMILGTQWYILFNVIAGASNLPKDLYHAAANFGLKKWVWWKRLALPAIFPYYVTGALTAAGGSWNASIVAEVVNWGDIHLEATGLGAYIAQYTSEGDFPRIFLGIGMMCIFVYAFNRLLWQRLYHFAQTRYSVH